MMGDVMDLARGFRVPTFGIPAADLKQVPAARLASPVSYYLRLSLDDRPGTLAKVATCLGDAGISIYRMRQTRHEADFAPVIIVTHKTTQASIDEAIQAIEGLNVLSSHPVALRIENI